MENNPNDNQLQIELKEDIAQGTYANLAIITHSSSEFILDFIRVMPGVPESGSTIANHPRSGTCQTIASRTRGKY